MAAEVEVVEVTKPTSKKRAWGKQRCKAKLVSIDHMDTSILTRVDKKRSFYCTEDLQSPDTMSNETLMYHLSRMKVKYSEGKSRRELIHLYQNHIHPKPQRTKFWRRKPRANMERSWTRCGVSRTFRTSNMLTLYD